MVWLSWPLWDLGGLARPPPPGALRARGCGSGHELASTSMRSPTPAHSPRRRPQSLPQVRDLGATQTVCALGACLLYLPSPACALLQMRANRAASEVLASARPLVPLGGTTAPPSAASRPTPKPRCPPHADLALLSPPGSSWVWGFAGGSEIRFRLWGQTAWLITRALSLSRPYGKMARASVFLSVKWG